MTKDDGRNAESRINLADDDDELDVPDGPTSVALFTFPSPEVQPNVVCYADARRGLAD